MNYIFADLKWPRKKYPNHTRPEVAGRFLTLQKYHEEARRVIGFFSPGNMKHKMLASEDAINFVAHWMMRADWGYETDREDGATVETWRIYCGRCAILRYISTLAGQPVHIPIDRNLLEHNPRTKDPQEWRIGEEDSEELQDYLGSVLDKLPAMQRECVIRSYIKEQPRSKIASELKMSREAVRKSVNAGMKKLNKLVMADD